MNAHFVRLTFVLLGLMPSLVAQQSSAASPNSEQQLADTVRQLQEQITKLQDSVAQLRTEANRYRVETQELERRIQSISAPNEQPGAAAVTPSSSSENASDRAQPSDRVSKLEEEYSLLSGKVDDQYQTKVESGSKYRVRFSGLVMLNLFSNRGSVDSLDAPGIATPPGPLDSNGSFAGSLRQSQVGVEVFGPQWAGAKLSGDLRFDFAGGFPDVENGATLGLMRLRTGNLRFDWSHTSLIAGQDSPMFSPLSPTSFIALAQPEFSYAGNLWTWVPQIQLQHWFDLPRSQRVTLAAGLLDPLTGEPPRSQFERSPQSGESSRQPGYSARVGWASAKDEDQPLSITAGGYFSRQNWGFNRIVDGWAATADWQIPLTRRFGLKGEFYRGRALGGFGADGGTSVLSSDVLQNQFAVVKGLNTEGGWAQTSFRASSTLQFNAGYGMDNPFSQELRQFAAVQNLLNPELGVNRSAMANVIYRPRSDLLLSLEYRHLRSNRLNSETASADNVGIGIGLLF